MSQTLLYVGWPRREALPLLIDQPGIELIDLDPAPGRRRFEALATRLRSATARCTADKPPLALSETYGIDILPLLWLQRHTGARLALRLLGDPWQQAVDGLEFLSPALRLRRRAIAAILRRSLDAADLLAPISSGIDRVAQTKSNHPRVLLEHPVRGLETARCGSATPTRQIVTLSNFSFHAKIVPLLELGPSIAAGLAEAGLEWTLYGEGWFHHLVGDRLSAAPNVHLPGFVPATEIFASRPIHLYLSGLDGLPGAFTESAAWGLPLVVNEGSAAAELCAGAEVAHCGADSTGMVAACCELADDLRKAGELGERAATWVRTRFDRSILYAQRNELLETLRRQ